MGRRKIRSWSVLVGSRSGERRGKFSRSDDEAVQRVTTECFPEGYTILRSTGGWFDPQKRRFIREESRQVIVCASHTPLVLRWARKLGKVLKQKELLVVEHGQVMSVVVQSQE
jgi:hypothetical protein